MIQIGPFGSKNRLKGYVITVQFIGNPLKIHLSPLGDMLLYPAFTSAQQVQDQSGFVYILFFYLAIDEVDSGDQRKSLLNAARARRARGFIKEIPFKIQHVQDQHGCEFTREILLKFFPQLQFSKEIPLKISSIQFFSQGNLL